MCDSQMVWSCPFPDGTHSPPGPKVVESRRGLRRHLVIHHRCDLRSEPDSSGGRRDIIVMLQGEDLERGLWSVRRGQKRSPYGPASCSAATSSDIPVDRSSASPPAVSTSAPAIRPSALSPAVLVLREIPDLSLGEDLGVDLPELDFPDELLELSRPVSRRSSDWEGLFEDLVGPACAQAASGSSVDPRPGAPPAVGGGLVAGDVRPVATVVGPPSREGGPSPGRRLAMAEAVVQAALMGPTLNAHQLSRSVARQLHLLSDVDRHAVDTAVLAVVALEELLEDRRAGIHARGLVSSSSAAPPLGEYSLRGGRPPVYSPTCDWEGPEPVLLSSSPIVISDDDPGNSSQDRLSDVEP
jgi:hypothetical protein